MTIVGTVIPFPVRRVCALGVPAEVLRVLRQELSNVALSTDAAALQRSDLLVVGVDEPRAFDIIRWVRQSVPEFPILFWSGESRPSSLAEHCRILLFGRREAPAASEIV